MLTPLQERYLLVLGETTAAGKFHIQAELCRMANIHEQRLAEWNRKPEFRALVRETQLEGLRSSIWLRAEIASGARAVRGSIKDWELYLQSGGPTSWRAPVETRPDLLDGPGDGGGPTNSNQVIVQLVGIPPRDSMDTLPPSSVLPAQAPSSATTGPK